MGRGDEEPQQPRADGGVAGGADGDYKYCRRVSVGMCFQAISHQPSPARLQRRESREAGGRRGRRTGQRALEVIVAAEASSSGYRRVITSLGQTATRGFTLLISDLAAWPWLCESIDGFPVECPRNHAHVAGSCSFACPELSQRLTGFLGASSV